MFQQGSIEGGSVGVTIGGGKGIPKPFLPDDSCGDDIFEGANPDLRSPQLPYLTQGVFCFSVLKSPSPCYFVFAKAIISTSYSFHCWGDLCVFHPDLWTCERKEDEIDVWVLENDFLKVTITPQYAGKVWGIFDKQRSKELLYRNKVQKKPSASTTKGAFDEFHKPALHC